MNNKLHDEGRAKLNAKQEAEIKNKVALVETLNALNEYGKGLVSQQHSTELSIQQTRNLAKTQFEGDDAVRQATVSNAILALTYGKTADQIKYMRPELEKLKALLETKSNVDVVNSANKETSGLQDQIESRKGLVAALFQGEDAYRKATITQKLYTLEQSISETADSDAKNALIAKRQAIIELTQSEWNEADAREALSLKSPLFVLNEENEALNRQIAILSNNGEQTLSYAENLAISAKGQENLNTAIENTINLLLKQGSAKDGMAAFFLKMQEAARSTASVVYDALTSAVDKVSDNLSKLLTGQKASWTAMIKEIGGTMLKSEIQTGLQKGLGAIGKHFGFNLGDALNGKPDGSQSKPFHVVIAYGSSASSLGLFGSKGKDGNTPNDPLSGIMDKLHPLPKAPKMNGDDSDSSSKTGDITSGFTDKLKGAFDGLGGKLSGVLGNVFGKLSGVLGGLFKGSSGILGFLTNLIPHADGGTVSPSASYLVGERGPELFSPSASGYISSNVATQRTLTTAGHGNGNIMYSIDARGTDATLVESRVRRSLVMVHNSAVARSHQIANDQMRRKPQKS